MLSWAEIFVLASRESNPAHALSTLIGNQDILVSAPAGCGKTEALARRASALIEGGACSSPRKILAMCYSTRARDNLMTRVRTIVGPQYWRRITVTNFHGFCGRVIRAHGALVGVDDSWRFPERGWRASTLTDLGIGWGDARDRVEGALRAAKRISASDDDVMDALLLSGVSDAIQFQEILMNEKRLDFDDLLRHGQRLLEQPRVANLYRLHFSAILVDEIQDLTLQQWKLIECISEDNVTAAGDRAQGIYSFAGAEPDLVFEALRLRHPAELDFSLCYRSAPAILALVNGLAGEQDAALLECAEPERWPDTGHVCVLRTKDPADEARQLVPWLKELIELDPRVSIGVVSRRGTRREALERELHERDVDFQEWDLAVHSREVIRLFKRHVGEAVATSDDAQVQIEVLGAAARWELEPEDAETFDDVAAACDSLLEATESGQTVEESVAKMRKLSGRDEPVPPGLHLLSGHAGKGQQFDWTVILGLEEGQVPDFRADSPEKLTEELRVLHVMSSRAVYGLVATYCSSVQTKYGTWKNQKESRWLAIFDDCKTEDELPPILGLKNHRP